MMTNDVFLFLKPFHRKVGDTRELDYLTQEERELENKLRQVCFQFAVKNKLVELIKEEGFRHPQNPDANGWVYALNWTNFRSLVDADQLRFFLNKLLMQNNQEASAPIDLAIDLHLRIGCLFDHSFLDVIVNRTMNAISLIPFKDVIGDNDRTWESIHKELPWLWCLIYTQSLIRTETVA